MKLKVIDHRRVNNRRKSLSKLKISHLTILGILLFLSFLTTACATPGTIQPTPSPPPSRTPVKLGPTSTVSPLPTTAVPPVPPPTLVPISPITDVDWIRGSEDAVFTFVVYSDFQ